MGPVSQDAWPARQRSDPPGSTLERWLPGDERELLGTRIFSVRERAYTSRRDARRTGRFLRLSCPDWVNVVARTTAGEILLIEQFRFGTDALTWEIPGGLLEPGEDPLDGARRELREETGYDGGVARLLGVVDPNPAIQDNRCFHVAIDGVVYAGAEAPDEHEEIAVHPVAEAALDGLLREGVITHSLVVSALHFWRLRA